jgi:hypothetical protein
MNENINPQPNKRKPGGQPGNCNARKHGLRSRKLTPVESEQLKTRVLLTCVEKTADILARRLAFLTAIRGGKAAFVGTKTNPSVHALADMAGGAETAVSIEPSRAKGYLNIKINVALPVPEILASEARMGDLIHQIKFFPHSTNDSPPAAGR